MGAKLRKERTTFSAEMGAERARSQLCRNQLEVEKNELEKEREAFLVEMKAERAGFTHNRNQLEVEKAKFQYAQNRLKKDNLEVAIVKLEVTKDKMELAKNKCIKLINLLHDIPIDHNDISQLLIIIDTIYCDETTEESVRETIKKELNEIFSLFRP